MKLDRRTTSYSGSKTKKTPSHARLSQLIVGHAQLQVQIGGCQEELGLAGGQVGRIRVPGVQKLMQPVERCPIRHFRHAHVEAVNEGNRALHQLGAGGLARQGGLQLGVGCLGLNELGPLLLKLDVCNELGGLDVVLTLLLLELVDAVGALLNDQLQDVCSFLVHHVVLGHLQALQLNTSIRVEGIGALQAEGLLGDIVELAHEFREGRLAHGRDEPAPGALGHVSRGVRGHGDHRQHVLDLPKQATLDPDLHIVAGTHLHVVEHLLGPEVDHRDRLRGHRVLRFGRGVDRPIHCHQLLVGAEEEGVAAAGSADHRQGACDVSGHGCLMRQHQVLLPHLDHLLVGHRNEDPMGRHQAALPVGPVQHHHGPLVREILRLLHPVRCLLCGLRHHLVRAS
mmetsp:Transcript_53306/g.127540  ORF Transcript_53306/g.127540 Transcript_53306/m.127540 type:complete len:397 (-) Transcript_53306:817-2007(-)